MLASEVLGVLSPEALSLEAVDPFPFVSAVEPLPILASVRKEPAGAEELDRREESEWPSSGT